MPTVPKYRELNRPDKSKLPLAWGIWGPDDQLGTLNHITEEKVRKAVKLVKRGVRFNLDLPLHVPYGEIKELAHKTRRAPIPTMHERMTSDRYVRDDKLDEFYLQCSSQWDGLTHMGDATHGFYNGVRLDQVTHGPGSRNGIERVAEFGLVTRGILVDIPRYYARQGKPWNAMAQQVVSAKELADCLKDQDVRVQEGDALLIRLGWVAAFRAAQDVEARDALLRPWAFSGLSGEQDMWRYLWDKHIAAVASDSVTVEVWPIKEGRPSLHLAIARLGLTIGEMFDFEALADDCAKDGEYRCLLTSKPLNLRGGVGSPPNAIAIK